MHGSNALVFAIAHEVGNHLGAIRLQAHFLDEDLDARALAVASVELDALAGRAGPLLALIRPLLSPPVVASSSEEAAPAAPGISWRDFLHRLVEEIRDEGTRGIRLESSIPEGLDLRAPEADWLHSLLIAIVGATLPVVPKGGRIALALEPRANEVALTIADDGPEEDLGEDAALRGRSLVVSIARKLLAELGGRVEWDRGSRETRLMLVFPGMAPAASPA